MSAATALDPNPDPMRASTTSKPTSSAPERNSAPIVAVVGALVVGLFLWRRRR